jgi:hypothetical protein
MFASGARAPRALTWVVRLAILAVVIGAVTGLGGADAHTGHPQKKLFGGHWWRVDFAFPMDLTTSSFFYGLGYDFDGDTQIDNCDFGVNQASCISKWAAPFQEAVNDWNAQPMDVNFNQVGNQNPANDIRIIATDMVFGNPNILGIGLLFNSSGQWCGDLPGGYDSCVYYYGDAWQGDNGHAGNYGTASVRRATVLHEIGHLINLRHESVNPDESQLYACGQDNTGFTPYSIMSYNCIDPTSVGGFGLSAVQDWDTCGVNHKYLDPTIGYGGCHSDSDGVHDGIDNCMTVNNPTQSNVDLDSMGDACDPDIDEDGLLNGSDTEADGDKVTNVDETNCGADPNDGSRRPERVDGTFAGVDDDGNDGADEALPPGALNFDCDGDGFKGSAETAIYSGVGGGNGDRDACGLNGWPWDLVPGGFQPNALNVQDVGSFVAPVRRLGTSTGDTNFSPRWDLVPGSVVGAHINVQDIGTSVTSSTGYPPMFAGVRSMNSVCPWAP